MSLLFGCVSQELGNQLEERYILIFSINISSDPLRYLII